VSLIDDPRDAKALELLKEIVACLVEETEQVTIETQIRAGKVFFGVSANPRDIGFLIGKHGRIAEAIRTVLRGVGKQSRRSYLVYFEPNASSRSTTTELSDKSAQLGHNVT